MWRNICKIVLVLATTVKGDDSPYLDEISYSDFSSRQLNLTSAAGQSLLFGALALLAVSIPFLYLLFLRNGGSFGGSSNSYSSSQYSSSSYSNARLWTDQKAQENSDDWLFGIPQLLANNNENYS